LSPEDLPIQKKKKEKEKEKKAKGVSSV